MIDETINSEIVPVLTCGCHIGFNWKTKVTYQAHLKSNRHISYVAINQESEHRKTITKLQNELIKIKLEHEKLKKMYLDVCYTNLEIKQLLGAEASVGAKCVLNS